MKHLILLRHASAGEAASDHERPLSARGHEEARRLREALRALAGAHGFAPRFALTSSALRARETLESVRPALAQLARVEATEALYLASPDALFDALAALAPGDEQVLVVGHNPGLSELARSLVARGEPAALARLARGLGTAGAAALRVHAPWSDLAPGCAELAALL